MKRFTIFGLVLAVAIVTGLNFADKASAQKERSDTTFESTEDSVRSPEAVLLTEDFTYAAGSLLPQTAGLYTVEPERIRW